MPTREPEAVHLELVTGAVVHATGADGRDVRFTNNGIEVILRTGEHADTSSVIARTTRTPPASVTEFLREHGTEKRDLTDATNDAKTLSISQVSWLIPPQEVVDFFEQAQQELEGAAMRPVRLLRWICNFLHTEADHPSRLRWSFDGEEWSETPGSENTILGWGEPVALTHEGIEFLQRLIDENETTEPIARDLLIEAVRLHPQMLRAALTLAVAAAEVGIKQFAAKTSTSESEAWLISTIPSPPLATLTRKYLPYMTDKRTNDLRIAPQELLKRLDRAVERRNEIVHRGATPPSPSEVEATLADVNDFLYLLDWFAGDEWAFRHLRPTTQSAWETGADG